MIIDFKVPDISDLFVDCRYNSMKGLLDYYKVDCDINDIFLLSHSYTFKYAKINFEKEDVHGIPMIVSSDDDIEYSIFESLGIPYSTDVINDSHEDWSHVKQLLSENSPIIFKIDERILKNDESILNERVKIRFLSIPVMLGYDNNKETVHLYWSWAAGNKELLIDLPMDRFNKYRNTFCLPNSPNYRCSYVKSGYVWDNGKNKDELINDAVKKIAKKMLIGSIEKTDNSLIYSSDIICGLPAMKKFGEDLVQYYQKLISSDDEKYKKFLILSILIIRNALLNGSKSSYQNELGNALIRFGKRVEKKELFLIGNKIKGNSNKWQNMIAFMGKLVRRKDNFSEGFKLLIDMYKDIYEEERIIYESFGEVYGI